MLIPEDQTLSGWNHESDFRTVPGSYRVRKRRGTTTSQVFERSPFLRSSSSSSSAQRVKIPVHLRVSDGHALRQGPTLRHAADLASLTVVDFPLAVFIRQVQPIPGRKRSDGAVAVALRSSPTSERQDDILHGALYNPDVQPLVGEVGPRDLTFQHRRVVPDRLKQYRGAFIPPHLERFVPDMRLAAIIELHQSQGFSRARH